MKTKKNFKNIEKWLFEYSADILSGKLAAETTIGQVSPVIPVDQMAAQLTRDVPPIEDEEYVPVNVEELSAAADVIADKCPPDQIAYFYQSMLDLLELAIVRSNTPEINKSLSKEDLVGAEIKRPIIVQKESKSCVVSSLVDYIIDVDKNKNTGEYMREATYGGRGKDFARKWKQGEDLNLYDGGDEDDGEEVEFHPDADDLMDFMSANDEDDASKIYGASAEEAERANKEYSLADILKSNIYPSASRESAITNKFEREAFPVLRAAKSAPQVTDRLNSMVKSDYAVESFIDAMYHSDLLSDESLKTLEKDSEAVKSSEMFKYFTHIAFVRPTMRELQKLEDMGKDVFDFNKQKSQISPEAAKKIMKQVKAAWERKNASQKSKIAQKAVTHMSEFEGRDKSVMG
jgi:hypothetical protein